MSSTKYKILVNAKGLTGSIRLRFQNGVLAEFSHSLKDNKKPLPADRVKTLIGLIPADETAVFKMGKRFNVKLIGAYDQAAHAKAVAKMAVWKKAYQAKKGRAYKSTDSDFKLLDTVNPVTIEAVTAYLECEEWWADIDTIGQFCKVQNQLADWMEQAAKGGKPKSKHPDRYDSKYEAGLQMTDLIDYWKHLNSLGYKKQQTGSGVMTWVLKNTN